MSTNTTRSTMLIIDNHMPSAEKIHQSQKDRANYIILTIVINIY